MMKDCSCYCCCGAEKAISSQQLPLLIFTTNIHYTHSISDYKCDPTLTVSKQTKTLSETSSRDQMLVDPDPILGKGLTIIHRQKNRLKKDNQLLLLIETQRTSDPLFLGSTPLLRSRWRIFSRDFRCWNWLFCGRRSWQFWRGIWWTTWLYRPSAFRGFWKPWFGRSWCRIVLLEYFWCFGLFDPNLLSRRRLLLPSSQSWFWETVRRGTCCSYSHTILLFDPIPS